MKHLTDEDVTALLLARSCKSIEISEIAFGFINDNYSMSLYPLDCFEYYWVVSAYPGGGVYQHGSHYYIDSQNVLLKVSVSPRCNLEEVHSEIEYFNTLCAVTAEEIAFNDTTMDMLGGL